MANFPAVFTYTVSAEVAANTDGEPHTVTVLNVGGLGVAVARHIAVEALASWTGRYSTTYTLRAAQQGWWSERKTEFISFAVENF